MSNTPSKWSRWIPAALLATLLSGCYVVPIGYPRGGGAPQAGEVIEVAPPAPQYEVVPAAPALGYVWIGGHWTWHLGRHLWIGGRWAVPPGGHHWVPHRWERGPRGWSSHPGHWQRGRGRG